MTDERIADEALLQAAQRLPSGAGIIFRHYSLSARERRALFARIQRIAKRRGLVLLLAGDERIATAWKSDGYHSRSAHRRHARHIHCAPTHNLPQIRKAERAGAQLIFLSPIFPTRSHPGARALGRVRFGFLARQSRLPVIALGGMTTRRAGHLASLGAYGWAAIDGLSSSSCPMALD